MIRALATGFCAVLLAAAGCVQARNPYTPPEPVDQVDAIELWANSPEAVSWSNTLAPDGVRVSVFLYQYRWGKVKAVLVKGALEFQMFDGRVNEADLGTAKPMQTWVFQDQELSAHEVSGPPGWGYAAQLGWGRNVPKLSRVTVVACYKSPNGMAYFSKPLVIGVPK